MEPEILLMLLSRPGILWWYWLRGCQPSWKFSHILWFLLPTRSTLLWIGWCWSHRTIFLSMRWGDEKHIRKDMQGIVYWTFLWITLIQVPEVYLFGGFGVEVIKIVMNCEFRITSRAFRLYIWLNSSDLNEAIIFPCLLTIATRCMLMWS